MTSLCSILPICHSIFHLIIKNWIFLKSTQNGLLKIVQYGIYRPLGSREIKKQKLQVDTVLRDTLYPYLYHNSGIVWYHSSPILCGWYLHNTMGHHHGEGRVGLGSYNGCGCQGWWSFQLYSRPYNPGLLLSSSHCLCRFSHHHLYSSQCL